jgi:hypothetical protein
MLSKPTTFVLGAGASCDFGFPTGIGLQKSVVDLLALTPDFREFTNDRMRDAIQSLLNQANWNDQKNRYLSAAHKIALGMPTAASIDNYLHTHQNDVDLVNLGKIAVALAILKAEENSPLRINRRNRAEISPLSGEKYRQSWYSPFIRMLTMGTQSNDPRSLCRNLRFVVFNYDRCLELILLVTLKDYYGLSENEALEILENIEIIHPYGSLGRLGNGGAQSVPFGGEHADVANIAPQIRTFTESIDSDIVDTARKCIESASTLVFLGFGYLPQNMELLAPEGSRSATRIHATNFGNSVTDMIVVRDKINHLFAKADQSYERHILNCPIDNDSFGYIDVENGTCLDLFNNHRMRLSV